MSQMFAFNIIIVHITIPIILIYTKRSGISQWQYEIYFFEVYNLSLTEFEQIKKET